MQKERETIHERLKDELAGLHYEQSDKILQRTHPQTWRNRIGALWNREIEFPLLPIAILATLVLGVTIYQQVDIPLEQDSVLSPRHLIEAGGNTYWSDAYEKAVHHDEN